MTHATLLRAAGCTSASVGKWRLDSQRERPGFDFHAVFIGPNDLHASINLPPKFYSNHKQFNDAVEHIRVAAKKHGVASGIHVVDAAQARAGK